MADQKISTMTPAGALTGAELVPAVQSGGNVRTTTQDIANLVSLSSLGASANGITLIGHTFAQMRADLDLEAGTDFVAYSAYSANALTLIGHTFAQMRTDLSLVPGTDVQVYSAKLAALAAQTWAADTITYQTSTSAVSTTALTAFGRSLIDDADAATARTTLGLVIGTNVQAYDADTAKTDVAQSWTANQIFGGSTADVASFYRSGAAAKTRWIESTNNNYHGIRNNANALTFDYNGTDYLTISSGGIFTFASNLIINKNDPVLYLIDSSVGGNGLFYTNESDTHRWGRTGVAYDMTLTAGVLTVGGATISANAPLITLTGAAGNLRQIRGQTSGATRWALILGDGATESGSNVGSDFAIYKYNDAGGIVSAPFTIARSTGNAALEANLAVGGQLEITGGALSNTNGLHLYFGSNISRIYSLQNAVAWRDLHIDGALTYLNANSFGPVIMAGQYASVNYGSNGASILYVGGANNQGTNIAVRANAGYSRGIIFNTGASSARWCMEATSTAESGGNAGSDFVLSSWTDAGGYLAAPLSITRSTGIATFGAAIIAGGPVRLASYTVAGLPAGSTGDTAYASNGRKNGEGAGAGTGVLVFKDASAWRACDTGATVAA